MASGKSNTRLDALVDFHSPSWRGSITLQEGAESLESSTELVLRPSRGCCSVSCSCCRLGFVARIVLFSRSGKVEEFLRCVDRDRCPARKLSGAHSWRDLPWIPVPTAGFKASSNGLLRPE